MCGFGWTVSNGATNFYWASDLLHRLLHLPKVGEGHVEHYSSGKYPGVLELAKTNSSYSVKDSDTLQYFALEAYAHDIAVPGVGCVGTFKATSTPAAAATSAAASSVKASATPSRAAAASSAPAAASSRPAQACTPHDDHWYVLHQTCNKSIEIPLTSSSGTALLASPSRLLPLPRTRRKTGGPTARKSAGESIAESAEWSCVLLRYHVL
jgi:hypothetical protein